MFVVLSLLRKDDHLMKIKFAAIAGPVIAFAAVSRGQTSWTISSPDSSVQATVRLANLNGTADYPDSKRL